MNMLKSYYKNWYHALIGHKTNPSDDRSNLRRYFSRYSITLSIFLLIESALVHCGIIAETITTDYTIAIMLSVIALGYFCWIVLLQPFIHGSFTNPGRLFLILLFQ